MVAKLSLKEASLNEIGYGEDITTRQAALDAKVEATEASVKAAEDVQKAAVKRMDDLELAFKEKGRKAGLGEEDSREVKDARDFIIVSKVVSGGKEDECDAMAIRQANGAVKNDEQTILIYAVQTNNYTIRIEQHQGRRHIVVPVVMMVEGVHNGSHGSIYHSIAELGKYPQSWDGIPVSIQHPQALDGTPTSANSPDVIDSVVVGRIYNTHIDGAKLKAEAWLDEAKLKQVSIEAADYIYNQRPLDVSVGVFTDDDEVEGDWEGEHYIAIARNHRPDHLALLPGGEGACSWTDGAGIRVNAEGGEEEVMKKAEVMEYLIAHGWMIGESDFQINAKGPVGWKNVFKQIQVKLNGMDTDSKIYFVEEVFNDRFIYRIQDINLGEAVLQQQSYTVNANGVIEFGNDMVPVVKKVEYTVQTMRRTKINNNINKGGKENMNKKIDVLIAMEGSVYTEDDKTWLETLEESALDKIIKVAESKKVVEKVVEPAQFNEEAAIQILKEKVSDPKQFEQMLSPEMRGQFRHGQQLYEAHRKDLMDHIIANQAGETWKEEDLKVLDTDTLGKIAGSIPRPVDYSANEGGLQIHGTNVELLLPPGVEVATH